jgi:hypothetical protein
LREAVARSPHEQHRRSDVVQMCVPEFLGTSRRMQRVTQEDQTIGGEAVRNDV